MNLRIPSFLIICCAPIGGPAAQAAGDKPNIIVFLSDDMGYGDPQCLNPDSKIPTPHIDRLATQGMTFTEQARSGSNSVDMVHLSHGIFRSRSAFPERESALRLLIRNRCI